MSTPRALSPEVWLVVFRHMSCAPLAHPKSNEKIPPNFQPTLAACSRVCKLFHDLAASHLYVCPVVDSLPLLIAGIDNAPLPGLKSKAELLARTRHLFLEETSEPDKKYSVSDEEVEAYAVAVKAEGDFSELVHEAQRLKEAEDVLGTWREILDERHGPTGLFPRLTTFSVTAVHGHQAGWPAADRSVHWAELYRDNHDAVFRFLTESPSIRHFCHEGSGMLSLESNVFVASIGDNVSITTHSNIYNPVLQPLCLGYRANWIVHTDRHLRNESDPYHATAPALRVVTDLLDHRRQLMLGAEFDNESTAWSVTGGLYVGIPESEENTKEHEQEQEEMRVWAEGETKSMASVLALGKQALPEGVEVSDSFEIRPLFDASCLACGWSGENAARPIGWTKMMDEFEEEMKPRKRRPKKEN